MGLSKKRGDGGLAGTETESSWPSGCYYCRNVDGCVNGFWLNDHQTGSANGDAKPLCGMNFVPLAQRELLLVGDSDIDYWHSTYTTFPRSNNVGVGGDTCKSVRDEADAMLAAFAPSWVLLVCGENDLAVGKSVSATMARLRAAVEKMVAAGARVLYIGTKPERDSKGLWDQYVDYDAAVLEYAASLAATAVGLPPLVCIDSYQGFNDLSNPTSLYASDELHLSGEGYTMWESWAQIALSPNPADALCFEWRSELCVRSSPCAGTDSPKQCRSKCRKACKKACAKTFRSCEKACTNEKKCKCKRKKNKCKKYKPKKKQTCQTTCDVAPPENKCDCFKEDAKKGSKKCKIKNCKNPKFAQKCKDKCKKDAKKKKPRCQKTCCNAS